MKNAIINLKKTKKIIIKHDVTNSHKSHKKKLHKKWKKLYTNRFFNVIMYAVEFYI